MPRQDRSKSTDDSPYLRSRIFDDCDSNGLRLVGWGCVAGGIVSGRNPVDGRTVDPCAEVDNGCRSPTEENHEVVGDERDKAGIKERHGDLDD